MNHFQQTLAIAALKEIQAALIVVDVEGIEDIADIDGRVAEEVFNAAILRLRDSPLLPAVKHSDLGPLNESQLCVVIETGNRGTIEDFVAGLQDNLRQPIDLHGNTWHLSCFSGVSLLGRSLLEDETFRAYQIGAMTGFGNHYENRTWLEKMK